MDVRQVAAGTCLLAVGGGLFAATTVPGATVPVVVSGLGAVGLAALAVRSGRRGARGGRSRRAR